MRSPLTMRFAALSAAIILGASAGLAGQAGPAGVRAAIEAANKKFVDGAAKKDAAMMASAYTLDAEAFPPNDNVVKGRAALQKMWQAALDSGIAAMTLTTTEVESAGSLAYETGTYTMKTKDGKVADRGKYCVVWKKVGNEWLLHRDIWSTSLPR